MNGYKETHQTRVRSATLLATPHDKPEQTSPKRERKSSVHSRCTPSLSLRVRIKPQRRSTSRSTTRQRRRGEQMGGSSKAGEAPRKTDKAAAHANRPRSRKKAQVASTHTRAATKSAQRNRCPEGNHSVQPRRRYPLSNPT